MASLKNNNDTTLYVFNENGIIQNSMLNLFCSKFNKNTAFNFLIFEKKDIDRLSTIYKKFSSPNLNFIIYDYGYVMKIEGNIKKCILLLKELDEILDENILFYISPTQRIVNSNKAKYPRGANLKEIAQFLDNIFSNNEYSTAINEIFNQKK